MLIVNLELWEGLDAMKSLKKVFFETCISIRTYEHGITDNQILFDDTMSRHVGFKLHRELNK
jgi:hypothetical protein